MLGFLLSIIMTYFLAIACWYIICAIGKWMVFSKLGEPGWKAWIPLYSDYILYRACWDTTPFFIICLIAIAMVFLPNTDLAAIKMLRDLGGSAAFVISALLNIRISRSFGHGYLFAFGLLFFPPVFINILGFGGSRYYGNSSF